MSIIFRPHAMGMLVTDALEKVQEFDDAKKMKEYIVNYWHDGWEGTPKVLFTVDDIVIDEKTAMKEVITGWEDRMHVCIKRLGDEDYIKKHGVPQCIGFCATKYKKTS